MSAGILFQCFVEDLGKGLHDFENDTLKVFLTNDTPDAATDEAYGDLTDLATSGGYTAGGESLGTCTWSQTDGTASLGSGVDPLEFAATSGFGPFRYAVLYNASSGRYICYWDKGTSSSVPAAQSFTQDFGSVVVEVKVQ